MIKQIYLLTLFTPEGFLPLIHKPTRVTEYELSRKKAFDTFLHIYKSVFDSVVPLKLTKFNMKYQEKTIDDRGSPTYINEDEPKGELKTLQIC